MLGRVMRLGFARPAPEVELRPWRPGSWWLVCLAAAVVGLAAGGLLTLFWDRGRLGSYEYHLWRWQADTLLGNVFARIGIGPDPDQTEGETAVRAYFKLTSQIRAALEADPPNLALADTLTSERSAYENDVERYVEGQVDEAVTAEGLQRKLPLFNGVKITWPPVDFEMTSPPQLLVRSPRNAIKRAGDTLLKSGLSLRDVERIEQETDGADTASLVVAIGGLAAYPAIVRDDRSFSSLLDTASHEWTHHYLAFYPLGQQWGKGGDAEALNETTANISGREIANLIRKAHPLDLPEGEDGRAPAAPPPTVDFSTEMRKLRLEVDALLAEGKVQEAEQTMEERRKYLEEHGITLRKLNLAYFAFYGTYADTPASSNPIGPKIERVWELTQDVGLFLRAMREVTNVADLDRTLAALEAGPAR
jgi:hypothetical protein